MINVFLLTQSIDIRNQIEGIVEKRLQNTRGYESDDLDATLKLEVLWDTPLKPGQPHLVDLYGHLVARIEQSISASKEYDSQDETIIVVDAIRCNGLEGLCIQAAGSGHWECLIAMLVLTFPEVQWVFGLVTDDFTHKNISSEDLLANIFATPFRERLFDPTGLRSLVRKLTRNVLDEAMYLPVRELAAAAIDEEKSYCYLGAYAAYRFGCRADVVFNWRQMEARFAPKNETSKSHGYWLLFEDMSLQFPDKIKGAHLLKLSERADHFPLLDSKKPQIESSTHRILVTSAHERRTGGELKKNLEYLSQNKGGAHGTAHVFKPTRGILGLWHDSKLLGTRGNSQRAGNVPDFVWPPKSDLSKKDLPLASTKPSTDAHGAPGKLSLVAETTLARARARLNSIRSERDAVLGAVLAGDALELVGHRNPTISTDALMLKHAFEVEAECQFSGVEQNILIEPRIKEIEIESRAISLWSHVRQRERAQINAELHVLNQLTLILRTHNRFDEEQICIDRVRHLQNTLWLGAEPWRWPLTPALRYIELLLSSLQSFLAAVGIWLLILGVLYVIAFPEQSSLGIRVVKGLENAVSSFFSVGIPIHTLPEGIEYSRFQAFVINLAISSGFLHLGILISRLYALVSRR